MLNLGTPRRILALCREHIGDVINTTGALRAIRTRFPEATIVAEVGERAVSVLEGLNSVDEVWARATHQGLFGKAAVIRRIAAGKFDLALVLDDSNTHIRSAKLAGVPTRIGVFKSKHRDWYTACVEHRMDEHDLFAPLARLVALLGVETLPPPELTRAEVPDPEVDVLLCVGASDVRKAWPLAYFGELAAQLKGDCRVAQLRAPGEPEVAGVRSITTSSIGESAALMAHSRAVVANDSAAAHIAAAARVGAVVLYGPTDPRRFAPWGEGHVLLRSERVTCDIMTTGCMCPGPHCRSMLELTPDRVFDAVRQLVSS